MKVLTNMLAYIIVRYLILQCINNFICTYFLEFSHDLYIFSWVFSRSLTSLISNFSNSMDWHSTSAFISLVLVFEAIENVVLFLTSFSCQISDPLLSNLLSKLLKFLGFLLEVTGYIHFMRNIESKFTFIFI